MTLDEKVREVFNGESKLDRLNSERIHLDRDNADTDKINKKLMDIFWENILIDDELVNKCKGPGDIGETHQRLIDLIKKSAHGKITVNEETIGTLLDVILELEKCKEYRTRAIEAELEVEAHKRFGGVFKEAWKEYNLEKHTRWEQRAKAFFKRMGLTTGKRQEKTNKLNLFHEYMFLISGASNLISDKHTGKVSKQEALKILAAKHGLASPNACLEQLMTYVRKEKKRLKENEDEELEKTRSLFLLFRLKGKKECDLSPEEKQALDIKWEGVKAEQKKECWITSGFENILPGKNPYKE